MALTNPQNGIALIAAGDGPPEGPLARFRQRLRLRRLVRCLVSRAPAGNEPVVAEILRCGSSGMAALRASLHASPALACAAAATLSDVGETGALRILLLRCYDEEWLVAQHGGHRPVDAGALGTLPEMEIARAVEATLDLAPICHDPLKCRRELAIALSGLRVLAFISQPGSYRPLWLRALNYGRTMLHGLASASFHFLEWNYTAWIREIAVEMVVTWEREAAMAALLEALACADHSVGQTAIYGLRRLGDPRSIPHLERIVVSPHHPLALQARHAIECLVGSQAETLTLLRASQEDESSSELLRPMANPQWREASLHLVRSIFPPAGGEK